MRRRAQQGFTYLGLIILVAVIGLVGAATLKIGALLQRAAAEQELLEIGAAYTEALRSYAAATPPGQPQQPPSVQALLRDPRFPGVRRHLRKLFIDPMTGKTEWGVMYLGDKVGVIGFYSLSQAKPFKVGNFDARFPGFDNKEHLSDWKFTASGQGVIAAPPPLMAPPPVNAAPLVPPAPAAPVAEAPPEAPAPEPEVAPPSVPAETPEAPENEPQGEPPEKTEPTPPPSQRPAQR